MVVIRQERYHGNKNIASRSTNKQLVPGIGILSAAKTLKIPTI
jgi:hypothetical protein